MSIVMMICDALKQLTTRCVAHEDSETFWITSNGTETKRVRATLGAKSDTSSITSAGDSAAGGTKSAATANGTVTSSAAAPRNAPASLPLVRFDSRREGKAAGGLVSTRASQFTRSVVQIIAVHVPRLSRGESVGTMFSSMDAALGVQLAVSSHRDYKVCVNFVLPGSDAEVLGVQPAAVVVSLNARSMRGLSFDQVEASIRRALLTSTMKTWPPSDSTDSVDDDDGAASDDSSAPIIVPDLGTHIVLEFSQCVQEMRVDHNPYEMTRFPSPLGQHLPGVKSFTDVALLDCTTGLANGNGALVTTAGSSGSSAAVTAAATRRRERPTHSLKHFWMSDRSSKTCYDCEVLFTFVRRRHHCRSCGQIFCAQCCARLPQSFGGPKVDASITRLRKQLVCHTCHRQLREGLQIELTGSGGGVTDAAAKPQPSPVASRQTLLLMPPHLAEKLERTNSDLAHYKQLDRSGALFDKDDLSDDMRPTEPSDKAARAAVLFSMFPKVQIVSSVQHIAHQSRLHDMARDNRQRTRVLQRRLRTYSVPLALYKTTQLHPQSQLPLELHQRDDAARRTRSTLKRSNSLSDIGNPSSQHQRWSNAEFKKLVDASNAEAQQAGTIGGLRGRGAASANARTAAAAALARAKAPPGTFGESRFGGAVRIDPFASPYNSSSNATMTMTANSVSNSNSGTGSTGVSGGINSNSSDAIDRSRSTSVASYLESDRLRARECGLLALVGLSEDARDDSADATWAMHKDDALATMATHARARIEERIFDLLAHARALSRLAVVEQHRWMQIIHAFAHRAALTVRCEPDAGDAMDVMEYVQIKCLDGGDVRDSFYIDGVLVHKSLARKGMRRDIAHPRILLIASELDFQRNKEAIASLESVAGQEVEYMHIVVEKLMTLQPDIVMFAGHVHRVAEELLYKENVAVVKNARLVDLQRIARCTGASLLASYDHVDKISDDGVIGTCKRFYVLVSDQEPTSAKRVELTQRAHHISNDDNVGDSVGTNGNARQPSRKKRQQRQNLVFEGGLTAKGCTLCLRGGSQDELDEVSAILSTTVRAAYNMRLQRAVLAESGLLPPTDDMDALPTTRSLAEEWFAKCSTSLYIALKSNSLSMRAALKETQSMCKACKALTRYNNISSLRGASRSSSSNSNAYDHRTSIVASVRPDAPTSTTSAPCTCGSKSSDALRERILFSTCWSPLGGKVASRADMLCIDFYSANDCSLGQFLTKYCFRDSDREFKRAFATSKLSFAHDTSRVTFRVKDLSDAKDPSDRLTPAAKLLRDISARAAVRRLVRSDQVLMWSRSVDPARAALATHYTTVPPDVWNYSFGKFLEDRFYGRALRVDTARFPHLHAVRDSRDPALVLYFCRRGRVVSVQCEPVEPVLHVAVQPALWQDHIDHAQQLEAVTELCDLARDVYNVTTAKIAESMSDFVTPYLAKHSLKLLRNEVDQWHSCFASKLAAEPPHDVFAMNAHFKQIYTHAAGWSLRITQAMQTTVKPSVKQQVNSPKSALPLAWFEQLTQAGATDNNFINFSTDSMLSTPLEDTTASDMAGNLENLLRFARSSATGEMPAPLGFSVTATAEVAAGMLTRPQQQQQPAGVMVGASSIVMVTSAAGPRATELSESWSTEDRDDLASRSFPAHESFDSGSYVAGYAAIGSTVGSVSSKIQLDAFRRAQQQLTKTDGLGYLTIPKKLLAWHPSLPTCVKDTTVLVNASQPTSVVAYSLCSRLYTKRVNKYIRKEQIPLAAPMHAVDLETKTTVASQAAMVQLLRSAQRSNVDHVFVDENQFQSATRFSCKSYYAMQFHALRRLYYGGDRNYVESLCHCEQWNAAGGKSGAGFLKTRDQRFIAKAIPEIEVQMFLSMANEYFCYMAKTFENNLSSMLSKVLGIYKVSITNATQGEADQKMCILVMENLMYGRDVDFSFDLKGKMEGRYKDLGGKYGGGAGSVLWDRNFVEMAGGIPLPLQESALSLLLSAIVNDTGFLASVQVTDYSMLIGYDVKRQEVVASIIDYIHKYDFMKMVEHAGKRLIQEEGEITVVNPKHYRRRFCQAMTKYFVTIPSRYTKVTTVVRSSLPAIQEDDCEVSPPGSAASRRISVTSNSFRP